MTEYIDVACLAVLFDCDGVLVEGPGVAGAGGVKSAPGALELLVSLPDNWAVVTSGSSALLRARMDEAGLPVPPVVVAGGDVERGKPAPDGYLEAARRLGIAVTECVVVDGGVGCGGSGGVGGEGVARAGG
ncbi:HAD-IA family hydrolase [Umezawaea sp. Da 62-37]|uniref:HAD-IA family hydrolase n=1 Tax=Umezawaea sp. Da 62-37 TaxID=3075927 RepID=UPI0028F6C2BA|nr:HAD-IA family hydrolase [Umezawaea sp. Da 62-37]WNV88918.1 HAD-IA family hydrolase [Umezawaea sp. Da 62-37]